MAATRERLLAAAVRLFGERGYLSTTVGDIEAEAGLSPRAGGFYRHFASKEAVLVAALEHWQADIHGFADSFGELLPLDDLRSELTVVARGTLCLLERQRDLFRLLGRDGGALPDLIARVHADLVAPGYRHMVEFLSTRLEAHGLSADGVEAMAAVALGSLAHYRQDEAIYGHAPAGASEEAFVRVWVDLWFRWFTSSSVAVRRS